MRVINWCLTKLFGYEGFHVMDEIYRNGLFLVGALLVKALADILITYLAGVWVWDMRIIKLRLKKLLYFLISSNEALIFISVITLFIGSAENALEGTSTFLQILFAITLDNYQGRFKLVVCSTLAYIYYIFGLTGLQPFPETPRNTNTDIPLFCQLLLIAAFLTEVKDIQVKSSLAEKDMPLPTGEEKKERPRIYNWLEYAFTSVAAGIFLSLQQFLSHAEFCNLNDPMCISIFDVLLVIQIAVLKRYVVIATTTNQLMNSLEGSTRIAPRISRRLDKASFVIEEKNRQAMPRPCTVAFLLGMFPMWTTFLIFSLFDATGSTFFLNQARNIDENFPIAVFIILVTVSSFTIDYLCDFLFRKIGNGQLTMQWRIGVGMTFSFICCIFAWRNVIEPSMHTNIFSLTPQFLLLGFMKGFSERGLQSFFRSLLSESFSEYRTPFGECVMCIGKFLTTLCILKFRTISTLGNYYAILTVLSFVNVLSYWVARCYRDDQVHRNRQYISASTRCLSNMMPNNPSYFSVSPRKMWSLLGPGCPRTPRRLDDAHAVVENQERINIFDYEYRDDL